MCFGFGGLVRIRITGGLWVWSDGVLGRYVGFWTKGTDLLCMERKAGSGVEFGFYRTRQGLYGYMNRKHVILCVSSGSTFCQPKACTVVNDQVGIPSMRRTVLEGSGVA